MALRPFHTISVCSGGGGLDLGFHLATGGAAHAVAFVEREAYAAACLVARMADSALAPAPVWDDINTFDGRAWRGAVDCVIGGTPCQDLSVAGKQAGLDGERSRLFYQQVRIADECDAPFFAWENVGGAARALPAVHAELARHGYVGATVSIRASDVGAPHRRRRFFLLAHRRGVRLAEFRSWNHDDWHHASGYVADGRDAGVGDAEREPAQLPRGAGVVRGEVGSAGGGGNEASRRESRPAGADVAHAHGERWEHDGREGPEREALAGAQRRVEGPSHDVADAGRARREGSERTGAPREGAGASRPAAERGRPLEWPPGPDDGAGWARVLATHPHLSPSESRLRGVADGLAGRVVPPGQFWADRLRLLGNGVVPTQAAAAFAFLWKHLEARQSG